MCQIIPVTNKVIDLAMRYRITTLIFLFMYFLSNAGCVSGKVEKAPQESMEWWPLFLVDSIPQLEAVEVPLDSLVVSEMLLEQMGFQQRIKLTEKVVVAFESWSPIGFLNPERPENKRYESTRQFAAYCTINNEISLVYNFVNLRYRPCRYLSEKWRTDVVGDSECTGLGVFESNIACPLPDSSETSPSSNK